MPTYLTQFLDFNFLASAAGVATIYAVCELPSYLDQIKAVNTSTNVIRILDFLNEINPIVRNCVKPEEKYRIEAVNLFVIFFEKLRSRVYSLADHPKTVSYSEGIKVRLMILNKKDKPNFIINEYLTFELGSNYREIIKDNYSGIPFIDDFEMDLNQLLANPIIVTQSSVTNFLKKYGILYQSSPWVRLIVICMITILVSIANILLK